jgi:hypothetical protein
VQEVSGEATLSPVLRYAAQTLHRDFAFGLWQAAKHAWKDGGLAWPALNLRLLSLIVGHAEEADANTAKLREEVAALRDSTNALEGEPDQSAVLSCCRMALPLWIASSGRC